MAVEWRLTQKFFRFIVSEISHYELSDANKVGLSLSRISRYLNFLDMLHSEYTTLHTEFIATMDRCFRKTDRDSSSEEQAEGLNERYQQVLALSNQLSLKIESIFLFGSIAVERIEDAIQDFFGVKDLLSEEKLAAAKGIQIPAAMKSARKALQRHFVKYRNQQITHNQELQSAHGTITTPNGTQVTSGLPEIKTISPPMNQSYARLHSYVEQFVELIVTNRAKCRYKLKSSP